MKRKITFLLLAAFCSLTIFADVTWMWSDGWNWNDNSDYSKVQIYGQVYANGVTTVSAGSDHASKISFQIGVSKNNGGPYTWLQDDVTFPSGSNNWTYLPHLNGVPSGIFYYTFRAKDLTTSQANYFELGSEYSMDRCSMDRP